jgi:hypothetical protein
MPFFRPGFLASFFHFGERRSFQHRAQKEGVYQGRHCYMPYHQQDGKARAQ